jgi:hypothetical protein
VKPYVAKKGGKKHSWVVLFSIINSALHKRPLTLMISGSLDASDGRSGIWEADDDGACPLMHSQLTQYMHFVISKGISISFVNFLRKKIEPM